MNLPESILLCRAIEAMFPAQRLDEQTPDTWAGVLADIPFGVAMTALGEIARERTFVAACDIRQVTKRMRTTTRRAIKQELRARGILADLEAEADAAICAGLVDFAGIDLLRAEDPDTRFYNPQVAQLDTWAPARRELGA